MLQSRDLAFAYGSTPELRFPNVEVGAGDALLVLGPSGSGKSTLLALYAGLLAPKRGTITVGGREPARLRGRRRDVWRGRHVGIVFQDARLVASQRVAANVQLARELTGRERLGDGELHRRLASLGVAHLADRYPGACSVGERQRVGILRALANDPSLVLADEPTSALDRDNALAVARLLRERTGAQEATLVVVTHDERIAPLFTHTLELDRP